MSKRAVIRWMVVIAIVAIASVFIDFAWSPRRDLSSSSPDKAIVVTVSSKWHPGLWFRTANDCHDITIMAANGRVRRRMQINNESNGWPEECLISWAEDSSSVIITFEREEQETGRLIIPVTN